MAFSRARFTVVPNGQTLVVSVSVGGSAAAFYTDAALTSQVTAPAVISTVSTYYVADDGYGPHVVSCKQPDGSELYGVGLTRQQLANGVTVAPLPSAAQVGAESGGAAQLALAPVDVLAETFPRLSNYSLNSAALTSGTMHMTAIYLPAGTVVTSLSFLSGTQAAVAPTNWWFALYSSSRALLGNTADQTSSAWAANTVKTVALTTPFTTIYSGLYYVAVMVAAGTVPSLLVAGGASVLMTLPPVLAGSSTTGLTTSPPDPAAALSGGGGTQPYAYVK